MPGTPTTSRRAAAALFAFAALAPAAFGAAAQEASPAATPAAAAGVLETDEGLFTCEASELGSLPAGSEPAAAYQIVSDESIARYRVKEELAQVGATEAVGETRAIIGVVAFDADGAPMPCSRFDVDLRTLQSDQARRDNYLYNNTLETEKYPLATFVVRGVDGLDGALPEGEETTFTLLGDFTVHGETRPMAWEATATRDGDSLTGTASTVFQMPDFGIEPPSVPVVLSLEETVRLEVELTASPAP